MANMKALLVEEEKLVGQSRVGALGEKVGVERKIHIFTYK